MVTEHEVFKRSELYDLVKEMMTLMLTLTMPPCIYIKPRLAENNVRLGASTCRQTILMLLTGTWEMALDDL